MLYFSFQKLEIYQLSKELVKDIYKLSSFFPSDEKYALSTTFTTIFKQCFV
jgi:hypothetical protein